MIFICDLNLYDICCECLPWVYLQIYPRPVKVCEKGILFFYAYWVPLELMCKRLPTVQLKIPLVNLLALI